MQTGQCFRSFPSSGLGLHKYGQRFTCTLCLAQSKHDSFVCLTRCRPQWAPVAPAKWIASFIKTCVLYLLRYGLLALGGASV